MAYRAVCGTISACTACLPLRLVRTTFVAYPALMGITAVFMLPCVVPKSLLLLLLQNKTNIASAKHLLLKVLFQFLAACLLLRACVGYKC